MVFENEVNLYGDAPIASKFSSQDTKFDVIQGHINAIISESEMIELLDGGKTMYSGMNDIKIDVTGLHGNISSLSTTVDGQTQQITEINSKQATYEASLEEFSATLSDTQSDLETTSQNLATLQLDTNRFKTTVSNTYSTKTQAQGYATSAQNAAISAAADDATSKANAAESNANAATDNKLRDYSTTSAVASMIQQESDNITLAVSRSYATKDEAQTAARTTITGDTIYYLAYASNTGVTTSTSGWTTNPTASSAQISESKKYLWTYHKYTYGDGHTSDTTPVVTGTYGTQGATISSTTYQQGSSPTTAPTGTWSSTVPSVAEGKYLWTKITYTDGNVSYSVAKQGVSGTSVTVSKTEYQAGTSPTSAPTGSWSTSIPTVADGNYLWTKVTYSDSNVSYSVAKQGQQGTSVTVLKTEYQSGTSPTSAPTGSWSTSIPSVAEGSYLWTKVTYSDNNVAYSVAKQGQSGTSVTVSGTAYAYKLSENGTSPPTGTWSPTPVAPTSTQYAWTRTTTTFSDGNTAVTYTVGGKKGDTGVGISKVTPLYYAKNNNTAPAKPSSKITTTTINTGVWTTGLPSLTNTYKYLFTCDQIEYDDSSSHIEWTTVVENKNTAELYTRLTTAEQKITDSAIIQTVSASGQFPAKGDIILAINEVGQSVAKINAEKLELSSYTPIDRFIKETVDKNGSFCGDGVPTSDNHPASAWTDDATKRSHIGDIYYNTANGFSYQYGGTSGGLLIKFDSRSATEAKYDYVIIYYKIDGSIYASDKFTGTIGAAEFFVPSNEFWVYWHSDMSAHDFYGFSLASVSTSTGAIPVLSPTNLPNYTATDTTSYSNIASSHSPYSDKQDLVWHYTHPSSVSTSQTFSWTRRKDKDITDAEAQISTLGESIELKVSKGDIASAINLTPQSALISAEKINLQGYLTITDVGDSGSTVISGNRITTGTISADRVMGGTFKAGGSSSGTSGKNGAIEIYNSYNQRIGRFDSTGLYMGNIQPNLQLPNFSIDTTGKVGIRLASSVANTVEMSTSGMLFAYPDNYYVAFGSGSRYFASTSQGAYAILAARDTLYSYYKVALYKNKIEFNTSNTMDASNSFGTNGIHLQESVHISMSRDGTNHDGYGAVFSKGIYNEENMYVWGALQVHGVKNRIVKTKNYSERLLYSYETASPMFGDVGEGVIGEDGKCYIHIDPIYAETVNLSQYQVFLQKYGNGECYVECRNPSYFVVSGTAGIKFGWEIKAKQSDFDQYRIERDEVYVNTDNNLNYIDESLSHIALINEERKPQND